MKQSGSHCLLLVVGEDYLRFGGRYAKVGARIEWAVGVGLSAPEGTKRNIEEVGQAGVLAVSVVAMVGCLEGWRMAPAGMSWQAVSAPSVSAFSSQHSSSSPFQSFLLISVMQLQLEEKTLTPKDPDCKASSTPIKTPQFRHCMHDACGAGTQPPCCAIR